MRLRITGVGGAFLIVGLMFAACNNSGLSEKPRASFADLSCLDVNGDGRINAGDADDTSKLPDFNADFRRDDDDAAFVRGVDIALDPAAVAAVCGGERRDRKPEYLVAHDFLRSAEVSCAEGQRATLVLGVGGGVEDLRDKAEAAGIRKIVNAILDRYDEDGVQTIGIISGPAIEAATNAHTGMEEWLTNVVRVHIDRYPCLDVVIAGHSHGAVTAEIVGSRIEQTHPDRVSAVVSLDRIESLYAGSIAERPVDVAVFNVFQRNNGELGGSAVEAPNYTNVDVSTTLGPRDGDRGGPLEPVNHVTIDNSEDVRELIVELVAQRSAAARTD
jgi:hypothetical protein